MQARIRTKQINENAGQFAATFFLLFLSSVFIGFLSTMVVHFNRKVNSEHILVDFSESSSVLVNPFLTAGLLLSLIFNQTRAMLLI